MIFTEQPYNTPETKRKDTRARCFKPTWAIVPCDIDLSIFTNSKVGA